MAMEMNSRRNSVFFAISAQSSLKADSLQSTLKEMSLCMGEEGERRRMYALLTCVITVAFDVFLGASAFVCAAFTDSSAGYAFALDCLLDVIAATFVIWRFYGSISSAYYSDVKENITCVCLGALFCLASMGIFAKSAFDLVMHTVPQQLMYVFILAGVGGVTNTILGVIKYVLGKRMKSQSLKLEAVNTLLSAVLALMLAVSDVLYFCHPDSWMIDPVTSLVVASILFGAGIRVLSSRRNTSETTPLLASVTV